MRLFRYHVALALRSLRRDTAVSLIMLLALALGDGVWSMSVAEKLRFEATEVTLSPSLHQVEILRPRDATSVFADGAHANPYLAPSAIELRTQQSYPELRRLAESAAPARQSAGIRAEVQVRGPRDEGATPAVKVARFTNADFFSMFE